MTTRAAPNKTIPKATPKPTATPKTAPTDAAAKAIDPAAKAAPPAKPAAKPAAKAAKPAGAPLVAPAVPKADDIAEPKAVPVEAAANGGHPAAAPPANGEHLANGELPEPPGEEKKKTRQQLTNVLTISISHARCATHLKRDLGDEEVEGEIKGLRKELKAAKAAGDPAQEKALRARIAGLSKELVRISSETPIAAAVVMDCLVKELFRYGMDQAIAGDRKIMEVAHLHDGNPEGMLHYPLFNKLPSFAAYNADYEEELRKERAAQNKAAKEAREAKKAAALEKAGGRPGAGRAPRAGRPAPEDDDDSEEAAAEGLHTKTTFFTYVENALKTVKRDEPYRTMRVSNRVREYLSELVAEGLARLANLARIVVQQVVCVRTMNAAHIGAVVHMLMADEGRSDAQIAEVKRQIDEKLAVYHDHLRSEKEKKAAALDAAKKTELERKKLEADLLRKKKQAELATKRAIEASQKARELTAETDKLEPLVAANRATAEAAAALVGEIVVQ
jgi:hypothetical protein